VKQSAVQSAAASPGRSRRLRLPLALALLPVAAFSAFGFLAAFEPNPWWKTGPWWLGCAVAGLGAVTGVVLLWKQRQPPIA